MAAENTAQGTNIVTQVTSSSWPDYFSLSEEKKVTGLFRVLPEDGNEFVDTKQLVSREQAEFLFRHMLMLRVVDARMMALQRQGRIGFYGEALGQEAAVIGSGAALSTEDWIVPALREAGVGLVHGLSLESYISQIYGNSLDVCKGRQMPCHPCDKKTNYVVMSSCVSSQIPHAVGIAWAMKIQKDIGKCCFGYMGDGGTSEADFHVALNFAAVKHVPCVLVCQNNQWAISTPGNKQTASETIAQKGLAYGMESLRVDGNDVLAVFIASQYAAEKARRGDGPTFIEFLTYRLSAHSSSDDPSRYRDETITDMWKQNKDPLLRMRRYLSERGWLTEALEKSWHDEYEREVRAIIDQQEQAGPPDIQTLVADVYEATPWHLTEQITEYTRFADQQKPTE